jgi:hypothetical protein
MCPGFDMTPNFSVNLNQKSDSLALAAPARDTESVACFFGDYREPA